MSTKTRTLVSLVTAGTLVGGIVGCGGGQTHEVVVKGTSGVGVTSPSVPVGQGVDVEKVWATHPLPDCPEPPIIGNVTAPPGVTMPSEESVDTTFRGVRSPTSESWVRTKLGWVDMWLIDTRAGIADKGDPETSKELTAHFSKYVNHVKDELVAGHDINAPIDSSFPEGCQ